MTRAEEIKKLIAAAEALIGTPYEYGAYAKPRTKKKPAGVDCSSFIQYVFAAIGVDLPRSSILQATKGREVKNARNLQAGDIVFFEGTNGHYAHKLFPRLKRRIYIGHVALCVGENRIIHARESLGRVDTQKLSELTRKKFYNIVLVKRVI